MKNKYRDIIRERLKTYRKDCLCALRGSDGYAWTDTKETLELLNKLLKNIPIEAWPKNKDPESTPRITIRNNNWSIYLHWDYKKGERRLADLKYKNDDHTAWVIEHPKKNGVFIDFDIGGS